MKESIKLEHVRKNRNTNVDYIVVHNVDLTKQAIVSLGEMRYADGLSLAQVIATLSKEIIDIKKELQEKNELIATLEQKVLDVETVNEKIIKGTLAL